MSRVLDLGAVVNQTGASLLTTYSYGSVFQAAAAGLARCYVYMTTDPSTTISDIKIKVQGSEDGANFSDIVSVKDDIAGSSSSVEIDYATIPSAGTTSLLGVFHFDPSAYFGGLKIGIKRTGNAHSSDNVTVKVVTLLGGAKKNSTDGNVNLPNSGVTAGSYTAMSATVNALGLVTAASSGTPITGGGAFGTGLVVYTSGANALAADAAHAWDTTNQRALIGAAATTAAAMHVTPKVAGDVAVLMRAFSGQTANLLETRNSSNVVMTVIDAQGRVGFKQGTPAALLDLVPATADVGIKIKNASSGQNALEVYTSGNVLAAGITNVGKFFYGGADTGACFQINITATTIAGLHINGIASQSSNYLAIRDSDALGILNIASDGKTVIGGTGASSRLQVNSKADNEIVCILNGHAGTQTSDYLDIFDGTGVIISRIDSGGRIGLNAIPSAEMLSIVPNATGTVGILVKAKSGQTADMLNLKDVSANVLFGIGVNGTMQCTFNSGSLRTVSVAAGVTADVGKFALQVA